MSRSRLYSLFLAALTTLVLASSAGAQGHSTITIHVGKSGALSGFGRNHVVVAPIAHGSVDTKRMAVEIVVMTAQMKVTGGSVKVKDELELEFDVYPADLGSKR